jgi:hypothetical protein
LKHGKLQESAEMIDYIAQSLLEWEEHKRSVNIKFNALRALYAAVTLEHRKTILKTGGDG